MRISVLLLSSLILAPAALPAFQVHPKPHKVAKHRGYKRSRVILRAPKKPKKK